MFLRVFIKLLLIPIVSMELQNVTAGSHPLSTVKDCNSGEFIQGLKSYKLKGSMTLDECRQECSIDIDCKHFNYIDKKGGKCSLLKFVTNKGNLVSSGEKDCRFREYDTSKSVENLKQFDNCPESVTSEEIPTMIGSTYVCARFWQYPGDDNKYKACQGPSGTYLDGDNQDPGEGSFLPMGSIFVKPGCILYAYRNHAYTGQLVQFQGITLNNHWGGSGSPQVAHGPLSILCRCEQKPIECVASDAWVTVVSCQSFDSNVTSGCDYEYTTGTTFSTLVESTFKVSSTLKIEAKAQLDGIFSATNSASLTTGYDWKKAKTSISTETIKTTVKSFSPAGYKLQIDQAHGYCGQNVMKTNLFRFTTFDRKGNVVSANTNSNPCNSCCDTS